jgi:nitrate reductase alpha subunit
VKYPMVRGRLLKHWRAARPWPRPGGRLGRIVEDPARRDYQKQRGLGGFVRSSWDEVNEIIAAANVYTIKKHGPDRIIGFSPIPAMSMVSYAAGSRYLSLIGGVLHELLRLVLRPAALQPAGLGRADRRARIGRLVQLHLHHRLGLQRAADAHPDAHFFTEVRYKGAKTWPSRPTTPRWPSWPTCGCTPSRAPTRRWPWPWAT